MLKLGEQQTVVTPDGKAWTLGRLELRIVRAWKEYVAGQVGDPFEVVERFVGKVADSHLVVMLKEAEAVRDQLRCFSMGCMLSQKYLGTEEGLTHFVGLLLRKAHPKVTEEDTYSVALEVNRQLEEVLKKAAGELPPNAAGPVSPEADGRASSTGGNSTGG